MGGVSRFVASLVQGRWCGFVREPERWSAPGLPTMGVKGARFAAVTVA